MGREFEREKRLFLMKVMKLGMKKRGLLVMQNVAFDRPVEDIAAYETEVAVYGAAGTAEEGPGSAGVVGEHRVGVLEECDGDWRYVSQQCILSTTRFQLGSWKI